MKLAATVGLVALASALSTFAPSAQAVVHHFDLTGQAAAGTYAYSPSFSAFIALTDNRSASGLLPALTVATGDTLNASIRFDRAVAFPASAADPKPYAAYIGFGLGEFDPARVQGGTTVFTTLETRFFDGSQEVQLGPQALPRSGCGNLLCLGTTFVAATQALRFDRIEMTAHIDGLFFTGGQDLGQVFTLASPGRFTAFVLSPVPEPSSTAMLCAGLLVAGALARRRTAR